MRWLDLPFTPFVGLSIHDITSNDDSFFAKIEELTYHIDTGELIAYVGDNDEIGQACLHKTTQPLPETIIDGYLKCGWKIDWNTLNTRRIAYLAGKGFKQNA